MTSPHPWIKRPVNCPKCGAVTDDPTLRYESDDEREWIEAFCRSCGWRERRDVLTESGVADEFDGHGHHPADCPD